MKPVVTLGSRSVYTIAASFLALCTCAVSVNADTQMTVDSVSQLVSAAAQAAPGTVIVMTSGKYELKGTIALTAQGTEQNPIIVRADPVGSVQFNGQGSLRITNSQWLVLEGFDLAYQARTLSIDASDHVRLTRLRIHFEPRIIKNRQGSDAPVIPWIRFVDGTGHRIDHSDIGPHTVGLGVTLLAENATRDVHIDHNYFHDRPRANANGAETIRLGSGGGSTLNAAIEDNLFENCDGEAELISLKSNGNVLRRNTFLNNRGQVVVRNGKDILISGNYFVSDGSKKGVGGIRAHGVDLLILDNSFENITPPVLETFNGDAPMAAEGSQTGEADKKASFNGYPQTVNVLFAANTILDDTPVSSTDTASSSNEALISIGRNRPSGPNLAPQNWMIASNVFLSSRRLTSMTAGATVTVFANTMVASGSKPSVAELDGAYREKLGLSATGPLSKAGVGPMAK